MAVILAIGAAEILAVISDGLLKVKVKPNKQQTKITGWDSAAKCLEVDVAAPPDKGKANAELLKFLKKFFGCRAELVRGAKSREKYLKIWES